MAHEELKKLYALDALETIKPWERWEIRDSNCSGEWRSLTFSAPLWHEWAEYRRKQPRETMKQIHNDREFMQAMLDGETVMPESKKGEWKMKDYILGYTPGLSEFPNWYPLLIKPKTISINGFDVPEPLREAPNMDDICYYVLNALEPFKFKYNSLNYTNCLWLSLGLLHSSFEAAQIHRNALLSFTKQSDTK